jgi:hypothetical protein
MVKTKFLVGGKQVTGEMCICGHRKIYHKPEVGGFWIKGSGHCTKCDCQEFVWKSFVFKTKKEKKKNKILYSTSIKPKTF